MEDLKINSYQSTPYVLLKSIKLIYHKKIKSNVPMDSTPHSEMGSGIRMDVQRNNW